VLKYITVICILLIITFSFYGNDYKSFYSKVRENNAALRIHEINKSLAEKKYEKAVILAKTADEKMTAEINHYTALSHYRTGMNAIHRELFSLILDSEIRDIEYTILEYETRAAYLDYQYAQLMDDLSYFKDLTLDEAFIEYKEKELELRQADWEKREARQQFTEYTGIQWDRTFLELAGEYSIPKVTEKEWQQQNLSVHLALLQSEWADLAMKNLPENASPYDVGIQKMEAEKARMEYEKTVTDSQASFREINQELDFSAQTMALIKKNMKAYEGEIRDAENKLKKKLIPEKELLQKKIYYTTLEKNYYTHLKNYSILLIEYISGSGKKPEEVFQ
jgi:hypothetical protein